MSHVDFKDFQNRRRGGGRQSANRRFFAWGASLLFLLSVSAMAMVWQSLQSTRVSLKYDKARRQQETLLSDLHALELKVRQSARTAELLPEARERLGLVSPPASQFRSIAFNGTDVPFVPERPGLLDKVVPAALAREPGRSRPADSGGDAQ